jgi:hypothetical protein
MSNLIRPTTESDHTATLITRSWVPAGVAALFIAGIPARLLMELWAPLGYLFWVAAPVVFLVLAARLAQNMTPAVCPQCRRRLRNGQQRCHKCAQVVV